MKSLIMKKKAIIISLVVLAVLAVCGAVGLMMLKDKTPNILLTKTTYHHPYKEVVKIEEDGKIYKSKIVDELTADGAPKDDFTYTGTVSDDDLKEITNTIDQMKTEKKKTENLSDSYGIAVNLGEDALYGCEYFAQDEVDKLNSIIEKYN